MYVNCLSNEIVADKYYLINPYDFIIGQYNTKEEARLQAKKEASFKKDTKLSFMILQGSDLLKSEVYNEVPCMNYMINY